MTYQTILADPPWQQPLSGQRQRTKGSMAERLPYPTMSLEQIKSLPVSSIAGEGCHLWLWTTNAFLHAGFEVMEAWGFKYLAPIHWIKPSGCGNYIVHRTQTLLMGYKGKCQFNGRRYFPNVLEALPGRHSQKPAAFYDLIESVSCGPRLEMFARAQRLGWQSWGNEIEPDIEMTSGVAV